MAKNLINSSTASKNKKVCKKIGALQAQPDVTINGQISLPGFLGSIDASVSCDNSTPVGSVTGTIFSGGRTWNFSSNSPILLNWVGDGIEKAAAVFDNVTVTETGGPTTTGCRLFVSGTRLTSGSWEGSYSIDCPSGLFFIIYGTFTGVLDTVGSGFCP